jgi:hypothetical protein
MVSLKSIAISSVCVMSMIGMSTQQIDKATNAIDDTLWPLAFQKQCRQQESQINTLNNVLNAYYTARGRSCRDEYRKIINRPYDCQGDLINLAASILWPASFTKQHTGFLITQAQAACLNEFVNGFF